MNTAAFAAGSARPDQRAALSVALWVFIGVASALFALFLAAYLMRMNGSDWAPLAPPWQLGLSTCLLIAASLLMQLSRRSARAAQSPASRRLLTLGGLASLGFLAAQLWAWQALAARQVTLAGNPAGSFFYLLTAMHGLHVLGGLVIYTLTWRHCWQAQQPDSDDWQIALCARYWHFLLAVWLLLYAALAWLTPELVQTICGTR
ncbi:MAG: cytochrome c oxidase subunit 3 [Burkholderiales bacterium]|nr:cytochrome c oxidase subunit 3 [Burkholderiales bacterium]